MVIAPYRLQIMSTCLFLKAPHSKKWHFHIFLDHKSHTDHITYQIAKSTEKCAQLVFRKWVLKWAVRTSLTLWHHKKAELLFNHAPSPTHLDPTSNLAEFDVKLKSIPHSANQKVGGVNPLWTSARKAVLWRHLCPSSRITQSLSKVACFLSARLPGTSSPAAWSVLLSRLLLKSFFIIVTSI